MKRAKSVTNTRIEEITNELRAHISHNHARDHKCFIRENEDGIEENFYDKAISNLTGQLCAWTNLRMLFEGVIELDIPLLEKTIPATMDRYREELEERAKEQEKHLDLVRSGKAQLKMISIDLKEPNPEPKEEDSSIGQMKMSQMLDKTKELYADIAIAISELKLEYGINHAGYENV